MTKFEMYWKGKQANHLLELSAAAATVFHMNVKRSVEHDLHRRLQICRYIWTKVRKIYKYVDNKSYSDDVKRNLNTARILQQSRILL